MEGRRFGKLVVLRRGERPENFKWQGMFWLCQCDCGTQEVRNAGALRAGRVTKCRTCTTTGHIINGKQSPTYISWRGMKERCRNQKHKGSKYYSKRGITFCERWLDFRNFLADMGERPEGLTLDRIDNDGSYSPDNCRWADQSTQIRNSRRVTLSDADRENILRELASGALRSDLALQYNVTWNTIDRILYGARTHGRTLGTVEERQKVWIRVAQKLMEDRFREFRP